MNLTNLIDFLPFYFKDNDTYKVDGKGLLERFLEICGNYFNDYVTKDIDNVLDILDIENTPEYYLHYFWEFFGQLPFAYGSTVDATKWAEYYNGLLTDRELSELSKLWVIPQDGPIALTSTQARNILKYAISLFKIRGTSMFFEIMFRLYGLSCTVYDPTKSEYDGWIKDKTKFDTWYNTYDSQVTYDNSYDCSQCIPVTFNITGHGFTSQTDVFNKFREAIETFFDRFTPYNVKPNINYGFTLNDNLEIVATVPNEYLGIGNTSQTTKVPLLILGEINEIPIQVSVSSNWPNTDLRYQVGFLGSDGQIVWGTTKHDNGTIFMAPIEGMYYFGCSHDLTKYTQLRVFQTSLDRTYSIKATVSSDTKITPKNSSVVYTLTAKVEYKDINGAHISRDCTIRRVDTGEVKPSGQTWSFTEPGEYVFEIVEFPVKSVTVVVEKEPVTYKVTCTPDTYTIGTGKPLSKALTTINIESNYQTTEPLLAQLIGDVTTYKSGDTFKAYSTGLYRFKCTLDDSGDINNYGTFHVVSSSTQVYRVSLSTTRLVLDTTNNYTPNVTVSCSRVSGSGTLDTRVLVVETGEILNSSSTGVKYYPKATGTYTFQSVAYPASMVQLSVVEPTSSGGGGSSSEIGIYIIPVTNSDGSISDIDNWILPKWSNTPDSDGEYPNYDDLFATEVQYQLLDKESKCKFIIRASDGLNDKVILVETNTEYSIGDTVELSDPGTYTFVYGEDEYEVVVTILDFPTEISIYCEPTSAWLYETTKQVGTRVVVTANKDSANKQVRLRGGVNVYDTPYDFVTATEGTYIFESVEDPTKTATFVVVDGLGVTPVELVWDAEDTSEKQVEIITANNANWSNSIT